MRLYIVRHGQSEGNAQRFVQSRETQLTNKGREQADFVGKRAESLPIEKIISSTYDRTRETTEIINTHIGKPVEYSELLIEVRRPDEILNKPAGHEDIEKYFTAWKENEEDPSWRYSKNDENIFDVRDRALKALSFLESQKEKNIMVVSHGLFIRMLIFTMLVKERDFSAKFYRSYQDFMRTANTGITVCRYNEEDGWQLITWNDYAHLGDTHELEKKKPIHMPNKT